MLYNGHVIAAVLSSHTAILTIRENIFSKICDSAIWFAAATGHHLSKIAEDCYK